MRVHEGLLVFVSQPFSKSIGDVGQRRAEVFALVVRLNRARQYTKDRLLYEGDHHYLGSTWSPRRPEAHYTSPHQTRGCNPSFHFTRPVVTKPQVRSLRVWLLLPRLLFLSSLLPLEKCLVTHSQRLVVLRGAMLTFCDALKSTLPRQEVVPGSATPRGISSSTNLLLQLHAGRQYGRQPDQPGFDRLCFSWQNSVK